MPRQEEQSRRPNKTYYHSRRVREAEGGGETKPRREDKTKRGSRNIKTYLFSK